MQYISNEGDMYEWDEIEMLVEPPYTDDNKNEYQFTMTY